MPATDRRACTRCRERKIRCGRERPQCSNCERDVGITCVYQNPVRRVNHTKLLCNSVDQLQSRLTSIELQLGRLSSAMARNLDFDDDECIGMQASSGRSDENESYEQEDEDEGIQAESPGSLADDMTYSHIFHSDVDMIDRYHGISSPFALCNRLQLRTLSIADSTESSALQELLRALCETAGGTEPFPPYNDQFPTQLPPKQQALAAVAYFFKHIDCATDIFVQQNLLANLERVYSQPARPGDDTWVVCLKAITLLVLGMEISTQADSALFGDFACSMLPSRAALVSSRLLNTPRLINVQTLILLSVAAQQFDPPGWSELLFVHACILARTMGLHKSGLLPSDSSLNDDAVERAKVLQSLYIRDKSLCITRGSVSWLPSYDCDITTQLKAVAERQASISSHIRLAMIQDEIYHMTCAASEYRRCSHSKMSQPTTPKSIRQHLDQLASDYSIFSGISASYMPRHVFLAMEFLSTRVIALKLDPETRHTRERLFADARASCLLLLIAHGDRSPSVIHAYHSSTGTTIPSTRTGTSLTCETNSKSFAALLDAFSVPAFFVLFENLVFQGNESDVDSDSSADWDLLRKVSACYTKASSQMPPQSYHSRVTRIFNQLIDSAHLFRRSRSDSYASESSSLEVAVESTQSNSSSDPQLPPEPETTMISSMPSILNGHMSDLSHLVPHGSSTSGPFSWESLLSVSTTLDPPTTLDAQSMIHPSGTVSSTDLLTQLLDVPQPHSKPMSDTIQWHSLPSDQSRAKKRLRTSED
uniref:C6 transcription factor n=1 Tax=Talaromyces stipitatus TaxID=28564 RepID=A0A2U9K744_9EURO|nr:C6 transcription factor [Talaromyces stipitatus]